MGKNAVSVNLLQDNISAFRENEITFNYASRIRISERHNLGLGAGISYQSMRLDGNALSAEEQNDAVLGGYLRAFSSTNVIGHQPAQR